MRIQNYRVIDTDGTILELNFKDRKEQSDEGTGYVFQVISDTDNIAVYRMIDLFGDDGYTGRWWKVDVTSNVISTGNDCAIKGRSVNYNDKVINCTGILCEYQMLQHM